MSKSIKIMMGIVSVISMNAFSMTSFWTSKSSFAASVLSTSAVDQKSSAAISSSTASTLSNTCATAIIALQEHVPLLQQTEVEASAPPAYAMESITDKSTSSAISSDSLYPVITSQETKTAAEVSSLEKNVRPSIKFFIDKDKMKDLEKQCAKRCADDLIKNKIKKLFPLTPSFLINDIVSKKNVFWIIHQPNAPLTDEDCVALTKSGNYWLLMYTHCIPILNHKEVIKTELKTLYPHISDDEVTVTAESSVNETVCRKIDELKKKVGFSACESAHKCIKGCKSSCSLGSDYEQLNRLWTMTNALTDESEKKILKEVCTIELCEYEAKDTVKNRSSKKKSRCVVQ